MSRVIAKSAQERRALLTMVGFAVAGATVSIAAAKKIGLFDAVDQMMEGMGGSSGSDSVDTGVENRTAPNGLKGSENEGT